MKADPITREQIRKDCPAGKFRLITRSDMDGLVCGTLLKDIDLVGEIEFVHPKDMQDGKIAVGASDISTNLPYVPGIYAAFDHHASEGKRNADRAANHIIDVNAPSAARVVYDFFGGREAFPRINPDMMLAVDKADAARFTRDDVLDARGWELLSFLMDARTGLGRFRDFRISNYQLMMLLIDACRNHSSIETILDLPDIRERVDLYKTHQTLAREQIKRCTRVEGTLAILDLRGEETIYASNRFMIYALFPQTSISVHVMWGRAKQNTVLAFGKSIFDRSNPTNVGELMLEHGGGGHHAAGTCQVENAAADEILASIARRINQEARRAA
ncbi:MAG: exopolyphosphatase [Beijerinckiaceae bacterium]|nr:exopolyphosphatase [Beijerinckiaceae bacterium]MCZ8300010.1 exopolyphosphatase [Beijerinckiaceae bacterium]